MFVHETQLRVRYGETDQMGYVYYGNYPLYYEVGRVEALRSIGTSYKTLEENGIALPVKELHIQYFRPAFYDEQLLLKTYITELPSTRIKFQHELFNEKQELINTANLELVFVNMATRKPMRCPPDIIDKLQSYF